MAIGYRLRSHSYSSGDIKATYTVEGYAVSIANDRTSGLLAIRSTPSPDLLRLDWDLPDFSGLEICRRGRATGLAIPILMLSAHDAIKDKVEALDAGADDYLIKPFSIEELLTRLRALHRRAMPAKMFSGPAKPSNSRIRTISCWSS